MMKSTRGMFPFANVAIQNGIYLTILEITNRIEKQLMKRPHRACHAKNNK